MTPDRPVTRITFSRLALGGDSVGYLPSGKVCFVRGAPLNELVSIDVVQEKRKFARGVLSEENHGEHCSSAAQCGGCPWHHAPRHVQRDALREHTIRGLRDVKWTAGEDLSWLGDSPSKKWRQAARFHFFEENIGYFGAGSHRIVAPKKCENLTEPMEACRRTLMAWFQHNGVGRGTVKVTGSNSEKHCGVHVHFSEEVGDWQRLGASLFSALPKGSYLVVETEDEIFRWGDRDWLSIGPDSVPHEVGDFVQANPFMLKPMLGWIQQQVSGFKSILELYAGSGLLTFSIAHEDRRIAAFEQSTTAVKRLKKTVAERDLENIVSVSRSDLHRLPRGDFDLCLLDPPRAGARRVLADLSHRSIRRVIYVSCNFETLRRDLLTLSKVGYSLTTLRLLEMFPNSGHVESIATLDLN